MLYINRENENMLGRLITGNILIIQLFITQEKLGQFYLRGN